MPNASAKTTNDYGPAEAAQHAPRIVEETGIAGVKRIRVQDIIDVWHQDGYLTSWERTAAEDYMRDVYDAGMVLSCEMKERVDNSKHAEPSQKHVIAKQNLSKLEGRLTEFQHLCLFYVVGMGESIKDAGLRWTSSRRLPRSHKAIKKAIKQALSIASRYYKLSP